MRIDGPHPSGGYSCHFGEFYILPNMMESIRDYVNNHTPVGSFLQAIIENDLKEAVSRADDFNIKNIPAFVMYFYNEAPWECWGSPQRYKEWIKNPSQKEIKLSQAEVV